VTPAAPPPIEPTEPPPRNPLRLLARRHFAPYFVTQLLGAFNDNVYKNALVALIAYATVRSGDGGNEALLINLAAGLFILPFFLFSAYAGQVAERHEKAMLLRRIKLAEIAIMAAGCLALFSGSTAFMIGVLFLMGVQSTFFGPIKYSILPQHLRRDELVDGNGLVELGTFLAILLGTIAGTQLITRAAGSLVPVGTVLLLVAVAGWLAARRIPAAPASAPDLAVRFEPLRGTWRLVHDTAAHRVVFQSILAISWFWFMGATYLAQFPIYARDVLGGNADVFTLLLATFSIGIGAGSMLCSRLSAGRLEIGLVPLGALGITLFGVDLTWATPAVPLGQDLAFGAFLSQPLAWRILLDVLMIGASGGVFIVPLYALIQTEAEPARLSRTIACNNILNALFMVVSALAALALLGAGLSVPTLLLVMALANALVSAYIFRLVPEFPMRCLVWLLIHTLYRMRPQGLERLPSSGAAILTPNHVSYVDALILAGSIDRPVRFVMHHAIYRLPVLNFVFRTVGAIPIAGRREDPERYERAFEQMRAALENGELLCLFPEGQLTRDGELAEFRPGLLRLLETHPVPVHPVALRGLWKSLFSRSGGRAFLKWPRRLFGRIEVVVGAPLDGATVGMEALRGEVQALRGERR